MKKKLFVLSMDAMVREDIAYISQKPNFKKIMEKRAEVDKVCTVYPASTYPAHTTLMTGCYPDKHGVFSNFPVRPDQDGAVHWPLLHTSVFAEDIFAAAKRAGLTTAAVYWPITGRNPNIDHIINEYFFHYNDLSEPEKSFALQGADEIALQAVRENAHLLPTTRGSKELVPTSVFDSFIMGCTCSLIRNVQPDLLMVHNCYLDSTRHRYGTFSRQLQAALDLTDQWLGDVLAAMEEAGVYEQTNFVILSDHGQIDCTKAVKMNVLLQQGGFQQPGPNDTLYDWQAYAQTNGKSTTIHLRDNCNQKLYNRVYAYLQKLQETSAYGIEKIWTKEELSQRYGQNGPYSFMIEAGDAVMFSNALSGDVITAIEPRGAHGYQPEKGPQPVFLAHGPSFRDGAFVEKANIVAVAPTLAATFGETMPEADGAVLTELLK